MKEVLPKISELVAEQDRKKSTLKILDLGCGTGRTTMKLLHHSWSCQQVQIEGWDASTAMLEVAKEKCASSKNRATVAATTFRQLDLLDSNAISPESEGTFDAVISTLVLEHFPLPSVSLLISRLLTSKGVAFVSNMHPDMGAKSVTRFDDERGTRRIGSSWIHGVGEGVNAAKDAGLEVLEVKEVEMDERCMKEGLVSERGREWVGTKVWMGMVVRKV